MNEMLEDIVKAIDKAKGMDTVIYHVQEMNPFIRYVVITSASNSRQLQALANYVKEVLVQKQYGYRHIEGNETSKWILVDSDDVVIHLFDENERSVYDLERIYSQCERVF